MIDDDEPMRMAGFIPVGDQERMITQEELDRASAFTGPVLGIFKKIPEDLVVGVVISVMTAWCLKFEDAEVALEFLTDQAKEAMPRLRAAQTATRQ